jgi:hypothetical protein
MAASLSKIAIVSVVLCHVVLGFAQTNTDDVDRKVSATCPGVQVWEDKLMTRINGLGKPPVIVEENKKYMDELIKMKTEDQTDRSGITAEKMQDPAYLKKLGDADVLRLARLHQLIEEYGLPTVNAVGYTGMQAFFILVQHADTEVEFQSLVLNELKLTGSGVQPGNVAMLTDRVRAAQGRSQLYGTQYKFVDGKAVPYPIEDEKNVESRREEMWLMPLADYECVLGVLYSLQSASSKR